MTREQLEAENKALRELLAAVRAYASLPDPASYQDPVYHYETGARLDVLAVYANGDRKELSDGTYPLVLQNRAQALRDRAARPLRYKTRDAEADDTYRLTPKGEAALDAEAVGCPCGHAQADHAFSDDVCAVPGCPCTGYQAVTAQNETTPAVTS